jgi:SprT protein
MLSNFLNKETQLKISNWEKEFNVKVIVTNPSKSRLGVFIPKRFSENNIRINNNLNRYSFLITLIHEMAHASIWIKYGRKVNPHGLEWKMEFKRMILPFLHPNYFPEDILSVLAKHMILPKASTVRDVDLSTILRKYDVLPSFTIDRIKDGDYFEIANGSQFQKICKLRKNYKCKEMKGGKLYRFSPLAEVIPL